MASGVKVDDEVKQTYGQISLSTAKQVKLKFAVFKFSDDLKKIIVDKKGSNTDEGWQYDSLIEGLPSNDVRYLAYDYTYIDAKDGTEKGKMLLVSWCPENSPVKKKMLGASSFGHLKLALGNPEKCLEGDCLADVSSKAVLEKMQGTECRNK